MEPNKLTSFYTAKAYKQNEKTIPVIWKEIYLQ